VGFFSSPRKILPILFSSHNASPGTLALDDPSAPRIPGDRLTPMALADGATFRGRTDPALIPGRMAQPISRIGPSLGAAKVSPPPHPTRGSCDTHWKWRPEMKKVFTTGQVAKICKVAPRTVSKWFDSGRLRGYRIPGSQDRRIPREHLIKFLKEHGMPLGELEEEGLHKILIIGAEKLFIDRTKEMLPEDDDFKYELAHSGFEAGIQAESFHPDTIIIDLAMGRSEALQIATNLRKNPAYEATLIVALASEDEANPEGLTNYGFNESFKKPFDVALLGERIRTVVEEKRANL
jgi:excisionase family DNA binding protein